MSRPQLKTDVSLWPGVAAIGLFVVLAAAFLGTSMGAPTPGPDGAFATEPKVVNVTLNDGETARLNSSNETGTVLVIESNESGNAVAQVPVDENASAAATLSTGGGVASVSIEKDTGIMASIGTAMFGFNGENSGTHPRIQSVKMASIPSEGFLVTFIIVAILLDAALDGSLMLAKREDDAGSATATDVGTASQQETGTVVADGGPQGGDDA